MAERSSPFSALDALLLLTFLNLSLQPLVDPDFGWHLRTGLDFLSSRQWPRLDPYSHTLPDWPWVEHAWLADALIGFVYATLGSAGALGVILLFAAVITTAFMLGAAPARTDRTMRLAAMVTAAWVALPFLGARMQMITLLGLAVVIWLVRRYLGGERAQLWIILPVFLLWGNLHGGFTAGLFALGLMLAAAMLTRIAAAFWSALRDQVDEPVASWSRIRHLALMMVMAALITLVNPYGWRLHAEIYSSLTDRFMVDTLYEWQPVSLHRRAGVVYASYLVMLGSAVLLFYRRIEPVRWGIWVVFLGLSLRHWRNVPVFLLVSLPLSAEMIGEAAGRAGRLFSLSRQQLKRLLLTTTFIVALSLVWLDSDHLENIAVAGLAPQEFFRGTEYPIEALQWIQQHRDELGARLYNDYGFGGFLLWWLPGEKIFIDGRMPAWRVGSRWILYDYIALTNRDPPELGVLDKYQVQWAMSARETALDQVLRNDRGWRLVYEDAKVAIHARR